MDLKATARKYPYHEGEVYCLPADDEARGNHEGVRGLPVFESQRLSGPHTRQHGKSLVIPKCH